MPGKPDVGEGPEQESTEPELDACFSLLLEQSWDSTNRDSNAVKTGARVGVGSNYSVTSSEYYSFEVNLLALPQEYSHAHKYANRYNLVLGIFVMIFK